MRGVDIMIVGVLCGVLVNAWGNEIMLQFPNGVILFTFVAILCSSQRLDRELHKEQQQLIGK